MSMSMLDEQDRVCADHWLTDGTRSLTLSRSVSLASRSQSRTAPPWRRLAVLKRDSDRIGLVTCDEPCQVWLCWPSVTKDGVGDDLDI